jgi:hypothetical protein
MNGTRSNIYNLVLIGLVCAVGIYIGPTSTLLPLLNPPRSGSPGFTPTLHFPEEFDTNSSTGGCGVINASSVIIRIFAMNCFVGQCHEYSRALA